MAQVYAVSDRAQHTLKSKNILNMRQVKSCGVIVMRREPRLSFLLMQHTHRYDLPKGHIEFGEDEWGCAIRELYEETGIAASDLDFDPQFRFSHSYQLRYKRYGGETVNKTVVIFLGWLKHEVNVICSEHGNFTWVEWNPPHAIQKQTIDALLEQLNLYFMEDESRIFR